MQLKVTLELLLFPVNSAVFPAGVQTSLWDPAFRVLGCVCAQSCLTVCDPWTIACQAPLPMEFSRREYWSTLQFPTPGDLPDWGIQPTSSALAGRFFTTVPLGKPFGGIYSKAELLDHKGISFLFCVCVWNCHCLRYFPTQVSQLFGSQNSFSTLFLWVSHRTWHFQETVGNPELSKDFRLFQEAGRPQDAAWQLGHKALSPRARSAVWSQELQKGRELLVHSKPGQESFHWNHLCTRGRVIEAAVALMSFSEWVKKGKAICLHAIRDLEQAFQREILEFRIHCFLLALKWRACRLVTV